MQAVILALFLLVILSLFSQSLQARVKLWLLRKPMIVFAVPLALSAAFCLIVWHEGALSLPLVLLILVYTFAPTVCAFLQRQSKQPTWLDFAVILMLWLPLECAAGHTLIPRPIQGFVHAVAYGVAITLALWLFVGFRGLFGIKYNLPTRLGDFTNPLVGFVVVAPVLIFVGLHLGFLRPFHPSRFSWPQLFVRYVAVFLATALPEEILFRGLIQNWLMQRFGDTNKMLLLAACIFGCSHLDNAPGPFPNWRYMIVATIAGVAFGKVFQKSSSILSSSALHALINTVKYAFF